MRESRDLSCRREEPARHILLLLLLHGGLLVLDLLDERLLVHELGEGLLLVDKLESDLRVFFTRVDQLENVIDRHFELERAQKTTNCLLSNYLVRDLTCEEAGIEFKVGPLLFFKTILVSN